MSEKDTSVESTQQIQKSSRGAGMGTQFFKLFDFVKGVDMFGAPLPSLNISGEATINSHCGGIISLLITYLTFLFAMLKT